LPNFPNPFNAGTHLAFTLPAPTEARLDVFDVTGRKVEELMAGFLMAGRHDLAWQAGGLPSGNYWVRLYANGQTRIQRLVLLK
jgi:hypothetical protein